MSDPFTEFLVYYPSTIEAMSTTNTLTGTTVRSIQFARELKPVFIPHDSKLHHGPPASRSLSLPYIDPSQPQHGEYHPPNRQTERNLMLDDESVVKLAYNHVAALPSKGVREKLIKAFNSWYQVPNGSLDCILKAIRMLHTASLLIDDIQDSSELRRGSPAAHTIYGVPQTINSANYMYFKALEELQALKSPQVVTVFAQELLQLHLGQGMDLWWRDMLQCPAEAEYLDMVTKKTGGLFRLALRLLACESSRPPIEELVIPLVEKLGVAFQIRDDYQNLVSSIYRDQKGTCEDFTEGKFSYPVIHCIRSSRNGSQLLSLLKLKSTRNEVKTMALKCVEESGSLEVTRNKILEHLGEARRILNDIVSATGGNFQAADIQTLLESLATGF